MNNIAVYVNKANRSIYTKMITSGCFGMVCVWFCVLCFVSEHMPISINWRTYVYKTVIIFL